MRRQRRLAVAIVGLAALVRIGFVLWAPREPSGDALHYHLSAVALTQGSGYVDVDGSPSIRWMPGWPVVLAGIYSVLGRDPLAPMLFQGLIGAVTTALLIRLGSLLWTPRCGLIAGILYAAWPGNVYYAATLMTEPLFSGLLVASLWCLVEAGRAGERERTRWIAGGGVLFSCLAFIKAEPLVLLPVAFGLIAAANGDRVRRNAVVFVAMVALLLVPWTIRNYRAFDRLVVTTATAGANAWLGNHPGASGGQSIVEMRAFMRDNERESRAETLFAASREGWRRVVRFASDEPGEMFAIWLNKLRLTYGSDASGARLIRGVGVGRIGHIGERQLHALTRLADAYWFGVLALVGIGIAASPRWSAPARWVCLGIPLCSLIVHLLFIGGSRFHVPETPAYALIAASTLDRWLERARA